MEAGSPPSSHALPLPPRPREPGALPSSSPGIPPCCLPLPAFHAPGAAGGLFLLSAGRQAWGRAAARTLPNSRLCPLPGWGPAQPPWDSVAPPTGACRGHQRWPSSPSQGPFYKEHNVEVQNRSEWGTRAEREPCGGIRAGDRPPADSTASAGEGVQSQAPGGSPELLTGSSSLLSHMSPRSPAFTSELVSHRGDRLLLRAGVRVTVGLLYRAAYLGPSRWSPQPCHPQGGPGSNLAVMSA